MVTNVYIDGFNLYYGALKTRFTDFKWLDVEAFCKSLLPNRQIHRIRYFTAEVQPNRSNPSIAIRQQFYLRALRTLPKVSIHYGRFSRASGKPQEKGSDVNLATFLLLDCFDNEFDEAVVISNDSDFATPIKKVRNRFNKPIGVINPHHRDKQSSYLTNVASWTYRDINKKHFRNSQFPEEMSDAAGTFRKPTSWRSTPCPH